MIVLKNLIFLSIVPEKPTQQHTVDSINRSYITSIYDGRLFNKETDVSMMMITLTKEILKLKSADTVN